MLLCEFTGLEVEVCEDWEGQGGRGLMGNVVLILSCNNSNTMTLIVSPVDPVSLTGFRVTNTNYC